MHTSGGGLLHPEEGEGGRAPRIVTAILDAPWVVSSFDQSPPLPVCPPHRYPPGRDSHRTGRARHFLIEPISIDNCPCDWNYTVDHCSSPSTDDCLPFSTSSYGGDGIAHDRHISENFVPSSLLNDKLTLEPRRFLVDLRTPKALQRRRCAAARDIWSSDEMQEVQLFPFGRTPSSTFLESNNCPGPELFPNEWEDLEGFEPGSQIREAYSRLSRYFSVAQRETVQDKGFRYIIVFRTSNEGGLVSTIDIRGRLDADESKHDDVLGDIYCQLFHLYSQEYQLISSCGVPHNEIDHLSIESPIRSMISNTSGSHWKRKRLSRFQLTFSGIVSFEGLIRNSELKQFCRISYRTLYEWTLSFGEAVVGYKNHGETIALSKREDERDTAMLVANSAFRDIPSTRGTSSLKPRGRTFGSGPASWKVAEKGKYSGPSKCESLNANPKGPELSRISFGQCSHSTDSRGQETTSRTKSTTTPRERGLWTSSKNGSFLARFIFSLGVVATLMGCAADAASPSATSTAPGCRKWEYACRNGRCVPGTKYCDSIDNCGDLSDEPRHCSPCNRTYYGAVGVTLDLEIHRPREDGTAFLCPLTITAAGGEHGDIVQVSFDSFTVGRFAGPGPDGGCPEGGLQIREKGRPRIGGWFCGTAWGVGGGGGVVGGGGGNVGGAGVPAGLGGRVGGGLDGSGGVSGSGGAGTGPGRPPVFFSESDAVTLVLSLLPTAGQHQGHPPAVLASAMPLSAPPAGPAMNRRSSGRLHTSYDFDFRISFKMLSKDAAVVRYGGTVPPFSGGLGNYHTIQSVNGGRGDIEGGSDDDFYLPQILHKSVNKWKSKSSGDLIPGTFCSRLFGGCDRRSCALQSPNYPGLYPRNLTCYFAVRQHRAPKGQVALIAVSQRRGHLAPIPTAIGTTSPPRGSSSTLEQQGHSQAWPECDDLHDYVTVYDGYTTRDPVLLRFCGGLPSAPYTLSPSSPSAPTAVSSGPELLVEFTSAPFGTLQPHFTSLATSAAASAAGAASGPMISGFPPTASNTAQGASTPPLGPASAIRGFQLQVKVQFVDQDSFLYARNKRCEFWIRPPRRLSGSMGPSPSSGEPPTPAPDPDGFWGRGKDGRKEFLFSDLRGTLRNPVHSLAANTTCVYHLIGDEDDEEGPGGVRVGLSDTDDRTGWGSGWSSGGRRTKPEYRVWLSVLKFHVAPDPLPAAVTPTADADECFSSLTVWDGVLGGSGDASRGGRWRGSPGGMDRPWDTGCPHGFCGGRSPTSSGAPPLHHPFNYTAPLLAKYCPTASSSSPPPPISSSASGPPRPPSCEHALLANHTREVRPCSTRAQPGPFQRKETWKAGTQQLPQKPLEPVIIGTIGDPPWTTPKEGFLSSGRLMDVQMIAAESTALRPVAFAAAYEFVDISQDGEAFGDGLCSRRFSSRPPASLVTVPSSPQRFTAPRNIFLYGRGGSTNLSCTYRFEVQEGERVRITVVRLLTGTKAITTGEGFTIPPGGGGGTGCRTTFEPIGPHHRCIPSNQPSRPPHVRLMLSDLPWHDLPVTRHCLCSTIPPLEASRQTTASPTIATTPTPEPTSTVTPTAGRNASTTPMTTTTPPPSPPPAPDSPFSYTSAPSRAVEVRFSAIGMSASHDPDSVFFEADVEFVRVEEGFFPTRQDAGHGKGKVVPTGRARRKKCEAMSRRRFSGPSGELKIRIPKPAHGEEPEQTWMCASQPYVIVPTPGRFLYVRTRGFHLMPPEGIVALPGKANASSATSAPPCPTRNRLQVYSGGAGGAKLKAIICPLPPTTASVDPRQRVELFSEGWEESSRGPPPQPSTILPLPLPSSVEGLFGDEEGETDKMAGAVVVEPMASEDASYSITWLEVVPRRSHRPLIPPPGYPFPFLQETVDANFLPSGECIHRCPELGACINASLWCDGRPHCPSGFDESLCEHTLGPGYHPLLRPPLLYASLAALVLLLLLLLALVLHLRARPRAGAPGHPSRHAPCPSCLPNGTSAKSGALDGKGAGS